MTLASHRLPKDAFKAYSKKEYHGEQPPKPCNACWHIAGSTLVVLGYNEDAKDVRRTASGGDPTLEIPWCSMDTIAHIMQRLEEKLMIPRAHWVLVAEGRVLERALIAFNSVIFSKTTPELVLVPHAAVDDYKKSAVPTPRTAVEIANTLFRLVEPLGSQDAKSWAAYIKQRRYLNTRLQELVVHGFDDYNMESPEGGMLEQIRLNTIRVLSSVKGVRPDTLRSTLEAVTPWQLDIEGSESGVGRVEMTTRIHSLRRPAAVDVKVDPSMCKVSYRVLDPVPADSVPKSARAGTWKSLLGWDQRDVNAYKGYRGPDERFDMSAFEVQSVKTVLYGDAIDISLVDTVRLLLASLGVYINLRIPDADYVEETPDDRYMSNEGGGNKDRFAFLSHELRYDFPRSEWLGVHIRRACNAPIPSDTDFGRTGAALRDHDVGGELDAAELDAMNY
ncbi:hypothetical protein AURDEDRAFT_114313 [Auricularia subglabra TFB-10046 SS5]|uniref:Uncharacterized protein n=1 Tax=Auricularia subglabra (strain TFB-10046 / SS5) TaxID=717982 RepID=J0D3F0_AURST|nr:hypothetical protein AURDEDRAFT_114313 [Auricularia subglabra TFB-10046 SS5]